MDDAPEIETGFSVSRFLGFSVSRFLGFSVSRFGLVALVLTCIALASAGHAQGPVYTDSPDICITSFASGIYQAEPSVFVDPNQPSRVLVTANTWTAPGYTATRVSPCISLDGGQAWQCQETAILPLAYGDPASAITKNGRHYGMFIHDFPSGTGDQGLAVSTSGGEPGTWAAAAFPGLGPPAGFLDRGHLWVDNSLATPELYAAWTLECPGEPRLVQFRHAVEDATLFWEPNEAPISISDIPGRSGNSEDTQVNIQSGPSSRVFACWGNGPTLFQATKLGFARSLDKGESWPLKTYITTVIDGGVPKSMGIRAPGQLGGENTPNPGITPCMAFHPTSGELLLVWANRGSPVGGTADPDIWLIKSPDFGDTWYGPFRVNQDATTRPQWFPWITVDDATGAVVVLYYDARDHASHAAEAYASVSTDCGESWSDVRLSDGGPGSPPAASYSAFFSGIGNDYVGVMARGGIAHAVWADDRDRSPTDVCPAPHQSGCSGSSPPLKLYTSPLLLGGIVPESINAFQAKYCESTGSIFKLTVSWQTVLGTDKARLELYPPGAPCGSAAPYVTEIASTGTSHSVFVEAPCQIGLWHYTITNTTGTCGVSSVECREVAVTSCASCELCRPPCELE